MVSGEEPTIARDITADNGIMAEQNTGNDNADTDTLAEDNTLEATQRHDTAKTETTGAMEKQEQRNARKSTSSKENRKSQGNYIRQKQGTAAHHATSEDIPGNARRNGTQQGKQKTISRTHARISNMRKQKGE